MQWGKTKAGPCPLSETNPCDLLIWSQGHSGPAPNIDKKVQLFRGSLAFSSAMEDVCSAQVQAHQQAAHSALNDRPPYCGAAFADINIAKG
jgi:hypothetical protein